MTFGKVVNKLLGTQKKESPKGGMTGKVYSLLDMPFNDKDSVVVGEFRPADSPELVEEITNDVLWKLQTVLSREDLHRDNRQALEGLQFHTFRDFVTVAKGEEKKAEDITFGNSLSASVANTDGYLSYIRKYNPDVASFFLKNLNARISESDRRRHTYVIGRSGSGKSELLKILVHSYLRKQNNCTLVVLDPHGDFAEEVACFKENGKNDRLVYIDPFLDKQNSRYMPVINPFDIKDLSSKNVDRTAQALLGAFQEILKNTALTNQMQALLIPCLTVLIRKPKSTLADLKRFMNDKNNADLVALGQKSSIPSHKEFFTERFYEKTYESTKASIYTKTQSLLNSETFYNLVVGDNTIDITKELNEKKLVIFNLSKGQLGNDTSEAFGRFIVAMIQSAVMKRAETPKHMRVPIHLFIDEFQNYVSPSLSEILAESRKYGLHMTLAHQYLGQKMDTDFKRGILANTHVKIAGVSATDSRVAISKETGVSEDKLSRLGVGQFYVKVGSKPAYLLRVPTLLIGNKHAMRSSLWNKVKAEQMERYYRDIKKETRQKEKLKQEHAEPRIVDGANPEEFIPVETKVKTVKTVGIPPEDSGKRKPIKPKFNLPD